MVEEMWMLMEPTSFTFYCCVCCQHDGKEEEEEKRRTFSERDKK